MVYNSSFTGAEVDASITLLGSELTISSGVITIPTDANGVYPVDTEGDASSDDLDSISGTVSADKRIVLYPANAARTIVVKHSANLALNASTDFTMNNALDTIVLISNGDGTYREISRSSNGD